VIPKPKSVAAFNWKQRFALTLLPPIAAVLIRLLGSTLRVEEIGEPGSHADENPKTVVYCLWHRSLLCVAHHFRKRRIAILISPSFDGEWIARTIERVGYKAIRGSSSREGAVGLRKMERALSAENPARSNYAAFTADGPRGPLYRAKPGAVKLAQLTDGGVGVFYAAATRAWELRSWDRFLIPKPFSTVVIGWQRPIPAPPDADAVARESVRSRVEEALERARGEVERHIAQQPTEAKPVQGRPIE
jgi:lysophospholipid acyltransferase (LPLAT)-like uncharacterized protein